MTVLCSEGDKECCFETSQRDCLAVRLKKRALLLGNWSPLLKLFKMKRLDIEPGAYVTRGSVTSLYFRVQT